MPPKSPKSGKKKLTKVEKEKLKKEEAEKKDRDEEEARQRALEEEVEQKERDKREAEERMHLENEARAQETPASPESVFVEYNERKKRKGQLQELESIWDSYRNTLEAQLAEQRKNAKWARYMRCDGSPDPTVSGEINNYINLWREDSEHVDIDSVLKDSQLTLSLIAELERIIDESPPGEISKHEAETYAATLAELQLILQEKLDLASHDLFLKASTLADPETMNLQEVVGNDIVTLCTWGNLSKNPRLKNHEFKEKGFSFEIPKVLTLTDCAIRILFTRFDHLSPHSKSFLPRIKQKVEEVIETPIEEAEDKVGEQTGEGQAEGENAADNSPEQSEEKAPDVMAALLEADDTSDNEKEKEEDEEEEKKDDDDKAMEEDYDIPCPELVEYEEFDGDEDVVDLRAYQVLGGVFHFDLLHLPPQPKHVKSWVITQVIEPPAIRRLPYVVDAVTSAQALQTKEGEAKEEAPTQAKPDKKDVDRPPIGGALSAGHHVPSVPVGVTMGLPDDVYLCEEPQVARWDAVFKQWRLDGFSDHKFDEGKKTLSFKTTQFGTMALMQDAHINMPFQSWELRPRAPNQAQLTVIAAIVEVEIQIKDDQCCLSQPNNKPELVHLINVWMTPAKLVKKMRAAGLNVFPAPDSHRYVSIQNKDQVTEQRLYQQMSLVASCMAFSWSKWNAEVNSQEQIVIQGTEHLKDEPLLEEDWSLFLITKKRTTKLKMVEYDETFSDDHADGTEFNADLYHMTMEIVSEDAQEAIRATNHKFVNTVYSLLQSTRLVAYS